MKSIHLHISIKMLNILNTLANKVYHDMPYVYDEIATKIDNMNAALNSLTNLK